MRAILCILLLCLFQSASAWNTAIHGLIADLAWQSLSVTRQDQLSQISNLAYQQLPARRQEKLQSLYPNLPQFVQLAGEPDRWRRRPLSAIYLSFHARIPGSLQSAAHNPIDHWHYVNQPVFDRACNIAIQDNIFSAIQNTISLLSEPQDKNAQAVQLILLVHLIGDLHQPLHVYSKMNKDCQSDYGGNAFCLQKKRHGKCHFNLHQFWDSGCGLLSKPTDIPRLQNELAPQFAKDPQSSRIPTVISDWTGEELVIAKFAYQAQHGHKPAKVYIQKCQQFARAQIILAAQRLATLLNTLPLASLSPSANAVNGK